MNIRRHFATAKILTALPEEPRQSDIIFVSLMPGEFQHGHNKGLAQHRHYVRDIPVTLF